MTDVLPWLAHNLAEWLPFGKAFGFFLATFVLEDAAAIGAGLLLATGAISWPAAFTACFLGIWLGDAGLYGLARAGGRRWFERSSFGRLSGKVEQSERWFARRGTVILIFSRMIPGTRLPTYLAAGFLRLPLPRFLIITGAASFVWTFVVLFLAQAFGAKVAQWLSAYKQGGLALLGTGLLLLVFLQLLRRLALNIDWRRSAARLARWRHWEFWPAWMFYPPVALHGIWLAIKYRGLTLPTAANPGMFSGGMVGESKIATLRDLQATSPEFTADAALVAGGDVKERTAALANALTRLNLDYPFVLKPDVGQRGVGIKIIHNPEQAEAYLRKTPAPLVVQRYVAGPLEAGIFYYRFPHEPRGRVFAITEKIFPVLTGDGRSTIAELIQNDPRARLISDKYLRRFKARQNEVPAAGKTLKLVETGNHAQGCIFRDGSRLHTPELEARIDGISRKLTGFFIGRYDVRYESEADFQAGRNFQIIELNGAASEATSIYDAQNSVVSAYRTLFQQWDLVFAIGAANRARGFAPTRLSAVWKAWRAYGRLAATYPAAD